MKSRMKDTLLLISSNIADRMELRPIFQENYYLLEAETAEQGIFLLGQNRPCIAAVIACTPVPQKELHALMAACHPENESELPVIFMLSEKDSEYAEEQLLLWGAADVVRRSSAPISIARRVQIMVDLYHQQLHLEAQVEEKNQIIHDTYQTVLDTLSAMIEYRDLDSGNHSLRIRGLTRLLLQQVALAYPEYGLDETAINTISGASSLHDIGKISISDTILNKPGPLTDEEYQIIKTHTTVGAELISRLESAGNIMYLRYAYNIALYHHERWDGSGYPKGLRGDEIPICAQVVGIIDAFDALTNQRSYKSALPYDTAANMICRGECGVFSPKVLGCFKIACPQLIAFAKEHADLPQTNADITVPLDTITPQPLALNALQLSHLKYQKLLHYLDDTVVEMDVDNGIYHVVYNPNPDFLSLFANASLGDLTQRMREYGVHPEDAAETDRLQKDFARQMFRENRLKCSLRCRIYNPSHDAYEPYEITILRINTENKSQRLLLAIFHNLRPEELSEPPAETKLDSAAFYDITNAILCCNSNDDFSIADGVGSLLPLTGYTAREIESAYGSSLRNMVHEDDRRLLTATDWENAREGRVLRLVHRTKGTIWVLCKCRLYTDAKGIRYHNFALTDVTGIRQEMGLQSRDYDRNRVVVEQFKNIIFEWNLETNSIFCSDQWAERFGYYLPSEYPAWYSTFSGNIHPDDFPQLRESIRKLREAPSKDFMDLRIANSEGRYLWSRIRAASVAEGRDTPTSIIGVIYDIHDLKDGMLSMEQKANEDVLTKLLNKASTKQQVEKYLKQMAPGDKAAALMLDIDNFKGVNDTYGHLYGDAVLTRVGAQLRTLFRFRDVIGRMGGDEFFVLLKDIPNAEVAQERCALLVDAFRGYFNDLMPELNVSISVGCVLIPDHGTTWKEIYDLADTALYTAKRKGKCQYSIYTPADSMHKLQFSNTRIDSDEQPVINDDGFMRYAFHSLYTSQDVEKTIDMLLAHIGTRFNVSRVYVFENNPENTHCSNTFEWCNAGIRPEKENLQNVSYETDAPNWPSYFDENGVVYCPDISQLPADIRQILEPQGIKSMLHCAIMDDGVFRGYVGFDDCYQSYLWTREQVALLEFFAQILSVFLLKYRKDRQNTGI